ncbi:MAG: hypothetical protein GYB68_00785 [Chloroflexi bacterium]|nr:hypothetical protein [Chloroflexota bacterium]
MAVLPPPNSDFVQPTLLCSTPWRYPYYNDAFQANGTALLSGGLWKGLMRPLLPALYIEWRYYSVISKAFHGIVGLALVNPHNRFAAIAESGVLVILVGVINSPRDSANFVAQLGTPQHREICWMHMFPTASCAFDDPQEGSLAAHHEGVSLRIDHPSTQKAIIKLGSESGLAVDLTHSGVLGSEIPPALAEDLRRVPAAHWTVYCPSPLAESTGSITLSSEFAKEITSSPDALNPNSISGSLVDDIGSGDLTLEWQQASGYYEHSFGINPLPLHGWDFLFAPDFARKQSIVLQTYPRSQQLRFLEVLWSQDDQLRYARFDAQHLKLDWAESALDPLIGVKLPTKRVIRAKQYGLRIEVENRIVYQIPLLRPHKLAVRHFFISEQIAFTDWQLSDQNGHILAQATDHPSGGELAHVRLRTPDYRRARQSR